REGETLYRLSKIYNTTVDELIKINRINDINDIPTGSVLKVNSSSDISKLHWPARGKITSRFGRRNRGYHYGIDIATKKGEKIYAASDGVVILSGKNIKG
ncbi:MAG: LysM peptidoglycan-binding domain-containing protein, partial [Candidatus Dadabacteria bacterium]|nr:LysM peptidoglycan-binding domain-containing protein [Candidatus Dadabacteria bacterium]NIQ14654.1 LysM peptidoglycan-binding domain-containing protein [Candidatus Dadabacteria bacterium]